MALAGELLEFFPPLNSGKVDDGVALGGFGQFAGDINQALFGQIGNKKMDAVDDVGAHRGAFGSDRLEGFQILRFGQGFPNPSGSTVQSENPVPGKVDHNHFVTDLAPRYPLISLNLHPHLQLSPLPNRRTAVLYIKKIYCPMPKLMGRKHRSSTPSTIPLTRHMPYSELVTIEVPPTGKRTSIEGASSPATRVISGTATVTG